MGDLFSIAGSALNAVLYLVVLAAFYYAAAMPLSRLAGGRGMSGRWLAWVPVAGLFYLLALADDISKVRRKRARLLVQGLLLTGGYVVLWIVGTVVEFPLRGLLMSLIALAALVTFHMAMYRLYTEYAPRYAIALTVMGVTMPIAIPIFLFTVRGERPRSDW